MRVHRGAMMRTTATAVAALLFTLAAGPALAAPFCYGGPPGIHFRLNLQFGGEYTESEQARFDLMALRQLGVDATRVERWNGCLRAFVRKENGHEAMEFYDPSTLERVY